MWCAVATFANIANSTCAPIQRVGILGAGAMGAIYASHFVRRPQFETGLVATGARAQALRTEPWVINGDTVNVNVIDPRAKLAPLDLMIVAVKHQHLEQAIDEAASLVGEHTIIMSVMNGLDSEEVLMKRFGEKAVLYCMALGMDSVRTGRRVDYRSAGKLVFGAAAEPPGDDRVRRVSEALAAVELAHEHHTSRAMLHEMWWKFMVNVGVNQASAVMLATYGQMRDPLRPQARRLMAALQEEVLAVSVPAGIHLGSVDLERWERVFEGLGDDMQTSMLQDVLAGRPTEVDVFAGKVVRLGELYGVETPTNRAVYQLLKVVGRGSSGS